MRYDLLYSKWGLITSFLLGISVSAGVGWLKEEASPLPLADSASSIRTVSKARQDKCLNNTFKVAQTINQGNTSLPAVADDKEIVANSDEGVAQEGDFTELSPLEGKNQVTVYVDALVELADAGRTPRENYQMIGVVQQKLLNTVKQDTQALEYLISAVKRHSRNALIKAQLIQVLSDVPTPEVEQFAKQLVATNDRENQIMGLNLLGDLGISNIDNLNLASSILLESQDDPKILLSALHALPKVNLPEQENIQIVNILSLLTDNRDDAVRSASLLKIPQWAKTEQQLEPVIQSLYSDVADDKISAAMALEQSSVVGERLKNSLLEKMSDNNELWEVRSMSANALSRFSLSEDEFADVERFRQQQMGNVAH